QNRRCAERPQCPVTHELALGDSVQLAVQGLEELLRGRRIAFLRRREQRGNRRIQGDISEQCARIGLYDIWITAVRRIVGLETVIIRPNGKKTVPRTQERRPRNDK